MTEAKLSLGHSRKPKGRIGVGGQPVLSWNNDIELQPTSSHATATSAQNTGYNSRRTNHQPIAETWTPGGSKQAFHNNARRNGKEKEAFGAHVFHSKNAPVKVSVTGEWALQECEDYTYWANMLMKRGKHRAISDIRKSIGDGQSLVYMLEVLASEKIPGVYARPITRAQKLENLQLCMSFMGNREINLQGIYVGDLIDGNLKSILALCGNLRKRFEGSQDNTPNGTRPPSSQSAKTSEGPSHKLINGLVSPNTASKDYDVDVKPHGHSSGYHSEEYSPTRKSVSHTRQAAEMPGMLGDYDAMDRPRSVNHADIIVSTTELDKKAVSQSGNVEQRRYKLLPPNQHKPESPDLISPSVEERLRSLLSTPNPGGLFEEETEDELIIPHPRQLVESHADDKFDVEERLKSLLDVAADDFSDDENFEPRREEAYKQLDRIGYVPSHPSEKMRNIDKIKGRNDSFTGARRIPGAKLPTPPALRRVQHMKNQTQARSTAGGSLDRLHTTPFGPGQPMVRTATSAADLYSTKPQRLQTSNNRRPASFHSENNGRMSERDLERMTTSPSKGRLPTHSDFLQQVANKLASDLGNRDTTTASSASISPADTPMLPALSRSSSIATFVMDSSSDLSGMSTPDKGFSSRRGRSSRSRSSGHGKSKSDMEGIRNQIQSLEGMYSEVLGLLDVGTKDSGKKLKDQDKAVAAAALQRTEEMKAGITSFKKQRAKDIKAVNKRFGRLESHVVTLARSVAHLSSELRSQAAISEDIEEMRKELQLLKAWREEGAQERVGGVQQSLQYASNLKRVIKLRKIFGEEPPLLVLFLKKLGYERFAPNFAAEQIGVLELPYINEERLQSLGIPLGPRLRIVEEARKSLL